MAEVSIATLKGYFQTGKYPTQTQFENLIDSLWRIIELQVADGWIQWSVAGSGAWNNLVDLATLKGDQGEVGENIELQVADGWIQWSVAGSGNWINLLEIGVSGSFESADNKTITVTNGIITDIQ